jgi:hypothetical protein
MAELGKSWQPFGGAGYFVLMVLLVLAIVMAVVIILLPLFFVPQKAPLPKKTPVTLTYFGLIGLAFLLVEIPLIQQFILYLGQPAYAFSAALFSILLFSGIGSRSADRFPHHRALILLVGITLISPWWLAILFENTLGYAFGARVIIAVVALGPLGFLMGMPLPQGIRKLHTFAPHIIPWAWGVNGALSVLSSILAALIALSFGFRWSLILGALFYAGAYLCQMSWRESEEPIHPPG